MSLHAGRSDMRAVLLMVLFMYHTSVDCVNLEAVKSTSFLKKKCIPCFSEQNGAAAVLSKSPLNEPCLCKTVEDRLGEVAVSPNHQNLAACSAITGPISLSVTDQRDYDVLYQFFKMGVFDEEYGYVLEGLKPISVRNFTPVEEIHAYTDVSYAQKEFANTLLVGQAIEVWRRICSKQNHFVLKATPLNSSTTTGWEVQFINLPKLKEVIQDNITLFQYILGPQINAEGLAYAIAYSNQDFSSILQDDLVLVGIVLGYGTQSSMVGGRAETIANRTISKDCPPFLPKSQLMLSTKKHSLNVYTPSAFGAYYLSFAGGDDSQFRDEYRKLHPSTGFLTIEDELIKIDAMRDQSYPPRLREKPAFIFDAFKNGLSNKPFFDRLLKTQKQIRAHLKKPDFLEKILEKIGGKKPTITCKNMHKKDQKIRTDFSSHKWIHILRSAANRFETQEEQSAFFQSYCHPTKECQEPPKMLGASNAMLAGIKKALANLAASDSFFEKISKDHTLESIVPSKISFKITEKGQGKPLVGSGRIRASYVIEDLKGNILFANCDDWLNLSDTILGFAYGVQGMHIGEKRILYIHPAYGYGALTTLPPCSGLVINIHLLDIDTKATGKLPPLKPLDIKWFQDPAYLVEIKSSVEQKPKYLGFLYKMMLDQIEGLDKSGITASLLSQEKTNRVEAVSKSSY
jgi:FKBP-type peptidyl-prolyl cis-trans isomerase